MHMSSIVPPPKRKTVRSDKQFPGKLYDLLSYAEQNGHGDIIGWERDGKAFAVYGPDRLVDELLPLFFGQTKYRSFRRQLNMWSFERVLDGSHKAMFTHPYFVKGQKARCKEMSRHDYQVAGVNAAQMAQYALVREVYGNAPAVLANSPGNIANLQRQPSPSSSNSHRELEPQELAPARRASLPSILPYTSQGFGTSSNDVMAMPMLSSSASAPPSVGSLSEMRLEGRYTPHEQRSLQSNSFSGTVPVPHQITAICSSSGRVAQPNSTLNVPVQLQSVQLSFDATKFCGHAPEKADSSSQSSSRGLQDGVYHELCNDSFEGKKMPAKSNADSGERALDDDEVSEGSAVAFAGRQFFFVDEEGPHKGDCATRTDDANGPATANPENTYRSGEAKETQPNEPSSFDTHGVSETSNPSSHSSRGEREAQNRLLLQFSHWKTHGPPDQEIDEDEFDQLFD